MHALSDIGLQLLPLNIIVPKPHQNRRLFFIQRKRIVHLFDEFRQGTVSITADVKVGIFLEQRISKFSKTRLFPVIFIFGNDFYNRVLNRLGRNILLCPIRILFQ